MSIKSKYANLLQEFTSFTDYGAVGDGVADDSDAINAALQSGKPIIDCGNTYYCAKSVIFPKDTYLVGVPNKSKILFDSNCDCSASPTFWAINGAYTNELSGDSNIHLEGFIFDGGTDVQTQVTRGIFYEVDKLTIKDCQFTNWGEGDFDPASSTYGIIQPAQAVKIIRSTNILLDNVVTSYSAGDGIIVSDDSENVIIKNCKIDNALDWGLGVAATVKNFKLLNNVVKDCKSTGIGCDRSHIGSIEGNTVTNCEHGIRLTRFFSGSELQEDVIVSGNKLYQNEKAGISVEYFNECIVTNNILRNNDSKSIMLVGARKNIVQHNRVHDSGSEAILMQSYNGGDCGENHVADNLISDCTIGIRELKSGTSNILASTIKDNTIYGATSLNYSLVTSTWS